MSPTERTLYIGVDPGYTQIPQSGRPRGKGQRVYCYAAINEEGELIALGQGSLEDTLAYLGGQADAYAAINAPRQANQGLMADGEYRSHLDPLPKPGRWQDFRVGEYLLRSRGIPLTPTPGQEADCPAGMRSGFDLYRRLAACGYAIYPAGEAPRQLLETNPYASFTALLGIAPFPAVSLEGRLQRQLALYQRDLDIPDPMEFFEEITPHRLLHGALPLNKIYLPGELDALVAALSARLAALHPDQVELLGDPNEGQITLPKFS